MALVALGGALGALARWSVGAALLEVGLASWAATLTINLFGSFAMGVVFVLLEARFRARSKSRLTGTAAAERLAASGWLAEDETVPFEDRAVRDRTLTRASAFLATGLLGGFTTFSSFSLEVVTLLETDQAAWALADIVGSAVGCLLMVLLGLRAGLALLVRGS